VCVLFDRVPPADRRLAVLAMSHELFRDLLAQQRVRLHWVHRPTPVPRLRTWHLQLAGEPGGPVLEIDTGLTTAEGDRYGEIVARATVKAVACLMALAGASVMLPSGEPFDPGWLAGSVRVLGPESAPDTGG
jgi:hypothetical protein